MFKMTEAAAAQVKMAAQQGGTEGMALRLEARLKEGGAIDYLVGFDEANEEDIRSESKGVAVVMAPESAPLLDRAVMDYVELNAGDYRFIFSNPKDANWSPPTED